MARAAYGAVEETEALRNLCVIMLNTICGWIDPILSSVGTILDWAMKTGQREKCLGKRQGDPLYKKLKEEKNVPPRNKPLIAATVVTVLVVVVIAALLAKPKKVESQPAHPVEKPLRDSLSKEYAVSNGSTDGENFTQVKCELVYFGEAENQFDKSRYVMDAHDVSQHAPVIEHLFSVIQELERKGLVARIEINILGVADKASRGVVAEYKGEFGDKLEVLMHDDHGGPSMLRLQKNQKIDNWQLAALRAVALKRLLDARGISYSNTNLMMRAHEVHYESAQDRKAVLQVKVFERKADASEE